MAQEQVCIQSGDGLRSPATIEVEHLSFSKRVWRTALRGGFVALLSLLLIAIPILHFLVVPLGLIIAVAISLRTFGTTSLLLEGKGACPTCNGEIKIYARPFRLPFQDVCDHCHRAVLITAKD